MIYNSVIFPDFFSLLKGAPPGRKQVSYYAGELAQLSISQVIGHGHGHNHGHDHGHPHGHGHGNGHLHGHGHGHPYGHSHGHSHGHGHWSGSVLWIRIRIGSIFRSLLDPNPYSEYGSGSGSTNVKLE